MKKLHLIIFALFIAVIASAQRPITVKQFPNNANQKESIPTATQVAEVNQRVNALIKDIESLYSKYNGMSDQWFKNEKDIKTKMQKERAPVMTAREPRQSAPGLEKVRQSR